MYKKGTLLLSKSTDKLLSIVEIRQDGRYKVAVKGNYIESRLITRETLEADYLVSIDDVKLHKHKYRGAPTSTNYEYGNE
jgi:hypothetical protein